MRQLRQIALFGQVVRIYICGLAGDWWGINLRRLTLFLKGNADLRDSLHSYRQSGAVTWNGLNHLLRHRRPDLSVRLRHETWARSDVTLAATAQVPPELAARNPPMGSMAAAMQFSRALFTTPVDAVLLSLQPDIVNLIFRHRAEGWLFLPGACENWLSADRAWLTEAFQPVPLLTAAASMANIERIAAACQSDRDVPVLVYNLCSAIPGIPLHCHIGWEDSLATRIRRFNLALVELSQRIGIHVIDVDAIFSYHGASRLMLDAFHFTPEGCQLVAEEVARVLEELLDL